MGSRSNQNLNRAYIAGFLDGDGSLMLQLKTRSDTSRGVRFMATICLYQDSRHDKPLFWVRKFLGVGYISKRKDGITEFRVNGFDQVKKILVELKPFVRFKKKQVRYLIQACTILEKNTIKNMTRSELKKLVDLLLLVKQENYKSNSPNNKNILYKKLGLTP